MAPRQDNYKFYSKLAQIYNCYQTDYPVLALVKNVLQKEGDINYKVPRNSCVCSKEPSLAGDTALHIAAIKNDVEVFDLLLTKDADFTIQNQHGRTALHCLVNQSEVKKDLIDTVFLTQLSLGDPSNPCDDDGFSHFHIACMTGHVNAVEFFLKGGIPVDMAVNADAKKFAGYTPLHFAAENCALSVINVLLRYNASTRITDTRGWTAFHVLLEQKIKMEDFNNGIDQEASTKWTGMETKLDGVLNLLRDSEANKDMGLTHLHVACTMQDSSVAESCFEQNALDIDLQVKMDSPFRPGYTALHFAAHCNLDTAKMLLRKNANFEVRDANGLTPMDLFWRLGKREDFLATLEKNWNDVCFSDGQTQLTTLFDAIGDSVTLRNFFRHVVTDLTTRINGGPSSWSGRTPLHIAVLLCRGNDTMPAFMDRMLTMFVDAQDDFGSTPIHLAFRANKLNYVKVLMGHSQVRENLVDNDGLSYLHIACALGNVLHVTQYGADSKNLDVVCCGTYSHGLIKPGSTALHVAMANGNCQIIKILLDLGMDLKAEDASGQTPLDRFFQLKYRTEEVCQVLLSSAALTDSMLEKIRLTRLLIAIHCKDAGILKYVDAKTVRATISCNDPLSFLYPYDGCTPLHVAIKCRANVDVIQSLLELGCDLLWANRQGETPLCSALSDSFDENVARSILATLDDNAILQRQLEDMSGITMLHLACHVVDVSTVTWLLFENVDVEARVKFDCPVWAGYTPLHVMVKAIEHEGVSDDLYHALEKLLAKGADVSTENGDGETPIHLVLRDFSIERIYKVLSLLIEHLREYDVNPVGRDGMSHFHAACLVNNLAAVMTFLENRAVDVNQPIDFFASHFPGETPLHLAVKHKTEIIYGFESQLETVDLLLAHGADVGAEDCRGETPLHKAVQTGRQLEIWEKLVGHGAAIDSRNIFEQTPLELLIQSKQVSVEGIKFFEKAGHSLNGSNPITDQGYLSMLISQRNYPNHKKILRQVFPLQAECFNAMANAVDWRLPDEMGRNLIHNIVTAHEPNYESFSLRDLIERFLAEGVDIDLQDKKGRTALHLAAQFGNTLAVKELMYAGADINVVDATDKSALEYAVHYYNNKIYCPERSCHVKVIVYLVSQISTQRQLKLTVRPKYLRLQSDAMNIIPNHQRYSRDYLDGLDEIRNVRSASVDDLGLCVGDFLSDTGKGLTSYAFMTDERRERVDRFFRDYECHWKVACARQYRKAVRRVPLVKLTVKSVWTLARRNVPIVCIEVICQYLSNSDLENFVRGTAVVDEVVIVD